MQAVRLCEAEMCNDGGGFPEDPGDEEEEPG